MTSCKLVAVYTLLILDWVVFGYTERARLVPAKNPLSSAWAHLGPAAVNVLISHWHSNRILACYFCALSLGWYLRIHYGNILYKSTLSKLNSFYLFLKLWVWLKFPIICLVPSFLRLKPANTFLLESTHHNLCTSISLAISSVNLP